MPINETEISVAVQRRILPGVSDNFFKNDPLLQFLKRNRFFTWTGGETIQDNFIYDTLEGGPYAKGATFNTNAKQTTDAIKFGFRQYYVNVTEYAEDLEIILTNEMAAFSKLQKDMGVAALTMAAKLAVAQYRHGQNLGANNDRSLRINGMEEAYADGTNATWSGSTFTSYGTQDRASVTPALDSPVGAQAANVAGPATYSVFERSYWSCVVGEEHPVFGVTTNRCMAYINENFQPQQRIDTKEPTIGYTGIKFKDATIVVSQYCPGQDITQSDIDKLEAARPASGETFWWVNPGGEGLENSLIRLWMPASKMYQFGFTGFKTRQNSTDLAGQLLFAGNLTFRNNRLGRGLFGITS